MGADIHLSITGNSSAFKKGAPESDNQRRSEEGAGKVGLLFF